jgi:serine/threonine protein phosphatase PrpC
MALAWHEPTGTLVAVVADGVSAAALSHVGAATVCRYAVEYALRALSSGGDPDPAQLVQGCAWALTEASQRVAGLAEPDPAVAEQLMASTLAMATVRPDPSGGDARVSVVVVGDSGVAVLDEEGLTYVLGAKSPTEGGITETAVVALPRLPDPVASASLGLGRNQTLLVGTDGVWDPVGDGRGSVGRHLSSALARDLPERIAFLGVVDFAKETHDDDRTLVAIRLAGAPEPDGSGGLGGAQGEGHSPEGGDDDDEDQFAQPPHPGDVDA